MKAVQTGENTMKNRTDTKRLLIDAAKRLLKEKGFFTVKDISEATFTNIASINYHFSDKNSLIREALNELVEEFKVKLLETFDRDFETDREAIETVLNVLPEFYSQYRGAIKYMLIAEDPELEQGLADKFFFDPSFANTFICRIPSDGTEADPRILFYKYAISISAFLFPLLLEGRSSSTDNMLSLTALKDKDNRDAFINTIMLLYK